MDASTMLLKKYRTNSGHFTSSFDKQRMLIVPLDGFDGPFFYVKSIGDGQYEVSGEGYMCDTNWSVAMDGQRKIIKDTTKKLDFIGRLGYYHLDSKGTIIRKEWFEYQDGKVGKPSRWILTDDDSSQCRKTIKPNHAYHPGNLILDGEYELIQVNTYVPIESECELARIAHGTIKMSDYTEQQICEHIRFFGHKSIEDFMQSYDGAFYCEFIAEMIFETESRSYELPDVYDNVEAAEREIHRITGLKIKY